LLEQLNIQLLLNEFKMKLNKIIPIFFLLYLPTVYSQSVGSIGLSDARSLGMAGTYVLSAKGLYSIGINPANLNYGNQKNVELILPLPLPHISVKAGTNFLTIEEYNYFFGYSTINKQGEKVGRYLTEDDKSRLKNLFKDGGSISVENYVQLFGLAITPSNKFGTIAFAIGDVVSANIIFPNTIIELAIDGNKLNTIYNFSQTDLKSWWLRKYSFSYSNSLITIPGIKNITFGISANYIQGFSYLSIDKVNTEILTDNNYAFSGNSSFLAHSAFSPDFGVNYDFDTSPDRETSWSAFPKPAGTGIGIDLGIVLNLNNSWAFGVSITDLGSINWNQNVAEYQSNNPVYLDDLTNQSSVDSLLDLLSGKNSGKIINSIKTSLASALHCGLSFQSDEIFDGTLPGKILFEIDYNKGFNIMPGNSIKDRLSFGVDWGLTRLFSFRTGVSFGGIDKFNWGLGFGFDFNILEINVGTPDFQYIISPNTAKRIVVGIDSRWKF